MNQFNALANSLTMAACLAACTFTFTAGAVAAEPAAAAAQVPGEKVDSGLGDLPHYRQWTDPTGKNPMGVSGTKPAAAGKRAKPSAAAESPSAKRYAVSFSGAK